MDNSCGLLNSRSQSLKSRSSGCIQMWRSSCSHLRCSLFLEAPYP